MSEDVCQCVVRSVLFPIMPELGFDPGTTAAKFVTIARLAAVVVLPVLALGLAITSAVLDATVVGSPAGLAVGICAIGVIAFSGWLALPLTASFRWSFSVVSSR